MTKKRSIIFFWVLFLVPTLLMAGAAFNLLRHEQDRINRTKLQALIQQAETNAQTIHLTLEGIRDNLTHSLLALPRDAVKHNLLEWERTNPLVRNVFIYRKGQSLIYPIRGMASTFEERQFISRYDGLFSGRYPFEPQTAAKDKEMQKKSEQNLYSGIRTKESSRKQLESLSRVVQQAAPSAPLVSADGVQGVPFKPQSGWLPWFYENKLSILIWVKKAQSGPVYGVELELMTLLSRLVTDFPSFKTPDAALVLTDGNEAPIHQSGQMVVDSKSSARARINISPLLPHWQISVYLNKKAAGTKNGFFVLSMIVLAIFILAIISAGILMTRMALQNLRDARQKTSFVSSVSHELKTPLTSIRMYAELLQSKRVKDPKKTSRYLSVIVGESERLTRLINNVLDFGRLEQGKKKYNLTQFELDAFLLSLIDTHKIRIKKHGLAIVTRFEKKDFRVRTDRDALEQVVLNLIDNVLKYAGTGEFIEFVLQHENQEIIALKICDDGPGIPKDHKGRIFEKFHRIDNSLTASKPGSGLGLSISRQILRDLGGDLFVDAYKGKGCCFTARIKNHGSDQNTRRGG